MNEETKHNASSEIEMLPSIEALATAEVTPEIKSRKLRRTVLTRIDRSLRDDMRFIAYRDGTTMSRANDKALWHYLKHRAELDRIDKNKSAQ